MSEKQPEALRLADRLIINSYAMGPESSDLNRSSAAELRRQHALLEGMAGALRRLQMVGAMEPGMLGSGRGIKEAQESGLAALAKWETSK